MPQGGGVGAGFGYDLPSALGSFEGQALAMGFINNQQISMRS
jgi:hypothetical protein